MSSSARLVIAAGFVVASIIAAAQLTRRSRTDPEGTPGPVAAARPAPDADLIGERAVRERPTEPRERDTRYQAIVERNVFRPLVSPPPVPGDSEAPSILALDGEPGDGGTGTTGRTGPQTAPADPMADLALTGITQVGDRLRALLEKVSTQTGRYVSVGDEFHGFRVVRIDATSVALEKDGKQHTLRLGGRTLASQAGPRALTVRETTEKRDTPPPRPTEPVHRGAPAPEGFGSDMLAWAESMSLPELERAYSQYSDYLSPEQRAQAESYLEQRRARGR